MVKFDDLINNELFICLLLIVIGYFIAKMFSNSCNCSNGVRNGFSVGAACPAGPNVCTGTDQTDFCYNKQVIPGLNNDVSGCYQQHYNYSHNCDPSDDRIIIPIAPIPGKEGEQPGWSPRCFSWDKDDDPRPIYDCVPDNGIESCTEGGDELIQDCKEYCGVEKFACMKVAGGMGLADGYQCRNLTLDERRNNRNGILPDDINPYNNGIYDTKDECNAANCGYNCIESGNRTSCQPNKVDQIAYKDDLTCLEHCRFVYVCRKGPGDECYKTVRILIDDLPPGERSYDERSECERHCEDKNHWCDDTGIVKECKCVGGDEPPEVFCNAINNVTCFSEDMCDLRCKPQNFVKYVCPTDPDYSTAGCVESTADSKDDPFSWDASVDNATELMGIAKENCDAQGGENSGVCNRRCSTEDSHFDWNDCTKVGNQCVKQGTIQGNWAPTGIFSDDTCDIPNKICTKQEANNCILDCNIPEWDDKCTVDGNNCYRNLTFKDEYDRRCVNKPTQELSCISLPVENYPNASAALMKKCNLNLQIQDVRDLIRALTLVVQSNTQSIVANLELIRNIQTKLQDLSDVVQELKDDVAKNIKDIEHLQGQIDGLTGRLSDLTTQLTNLSGKVDTNTSSLTDLGNQVNDIDTHVTGLQSDVTGLGGRVTDLQSDVTGLGGRVTDLEGKLPSNFDLTTLSTLQESVEHNTSNLLKYNNDINNIIEGVNSAIDTANNYLDGDETPMTKLTKRQ